MIHTFIQLSYCLTFMHFFIKLITLFKVILFQQLLYCSTFIYFVKHLFQHLLSLHIYLNVNLLTLVYHVTVQLYSINKHINHIFALSIKNQFTI